MRDLEPGLYWYDAQADRIEATAKMGKLADAISDTAGTQKCMNQAAVNIIISAEAARTAQKYGERAATYVYLEAGHVAQNILLMAQARGFDARPIASIEYTSLQTLMGLGKERVPFYLICIGQKP